MNLAAYRSSILLVFLCSVGCVTAQRTTSSAKVGQSIAMVATCDGTPPFHFKWEKDGKPISNASGATLIIRNVQRSDAGVYVCVVSKSSAAASGHLRLVVGDQ